VTSSKAPQTVSDVRSLTTDDNLQFIASDSTARDQPNQDPTEEDLVGINNPVSLDKSS